MSNHAIQTTLSKAGFPGKPKKVKVHVPVDLDKVQKCRDPYKPERVVLERKYEELFKNIAQGDCWRVQGGSGEVSAFARALRAHMERKNIKGIVRQSSRTEDGIPRVWLIKIFDKDGKPS